MYTVRTSKFYIGLHNLSGSEKCIGNTYILLWVTFYSEINYFTWLLSGLEIGIETGFKTV